MAGPAYERPRDPYFWFPIIVEAGVAVLTRQMTILLLRFLLLVGGLGHYRT
jgi:hypothetical protein